jgi:hypothetical protein
LPLFLVARPIASSGSAREEIKESWGILIFLVPRARVGA